MTDSPPARRHRGHRRAPRRRRGLVGPAVSALSVLLAIGPVVWLMTNDGSANAENDPTAVQNVADDSGPAAVEGTSLDGKPSITITKTLPDGRTTTVIGPAKLGPAASTGADPTEPAAGDTPGTTATTGVPTETPGSTADPRTLPTEGVTTVTVPPSRTTSGRPGRPKTRPTVGQSRPTQTTSRPTRTPTTTEPTREPSEPPKGGGGTSSEEREILDLTNAVRREAGCGPVRLADSLVEAAGRHASDMVRRKYMKHTNPEGEGPGDRMRRAGYQGSSWGENIAAGYTSPQKVFRAWMNSEGHRNNILNCRFNLLGVGFDPGRVKDDWGPGSWVQDFGRSNN